MDTGAAESNRFRENLAAFGDSVEQFCSNFPLIKNTLSSTGSLLTHLAQEGGRDDVDAAKQANLTNSNSN